jgi:hypothetical protein
MTIWYLAHIAGFTMWLGGGLGGMVVGIRGRQEDRATQAVIVRALTWIHRILMFPGILLTLASGVALTIPVMQSGNTSSWLMLMQVTGFLAAIMVLFVSLPTLARLNRISPLGETAPAFDALRKRQALAGMIAGILGLIALLAGVLHKY